MKEKSNETREWPYLVKVFRLQTFHLKYNLTCISPEMHAVQHKMCAFHAFQADLRKNIEAS